jgi:hypothetical protein
MKAFLDASVFAAAFLGDHNQHDVSVKLVKNATPNTASCAAHTVAEVYSTMTRLPVKPPIPAERARPASLEFRWQSLEFPDRGSIADLRSDDLPGGSELSRREEPLGNRRCRVALTGFDIGRSSFESVPLSVETAMALARIPRDRVPDRFIAATALA